jgi:hypothetical protein
MTRGDKFFNYSAIFMYSGSITHLALCWFLQQPPSFAWLILAFECMGWQVFACTLRLYHNKITLD